DLGRHPGPCGLVHRWMGALRAVEDNRWRGPRTGRAAAIRGTCRGHVPACGVAGSGAQLRRHVRRGQADGEEGRQVPPILGGPQVPLLSDRRNIVVLVDEAHRSNYDFVDGFARHLRDALPSATYIGFTGTPIERADHSTRQVFGEYIDIYDLTQAITDGATV